MAVKQEIADGIVQGLSQFWKCEEFQDFTVKIGTVQFGCHQLILASCSDFFKGLFRSGMQEKEQKYATIYDISSEIFEMLLESMYTGHNVLTNDNVLDIWRAAHQLQIHFMVSECENFVTETLSLENYLVYLQTCKALGSTNAQEKVWAFIKKNCNHFFGTSYFLEIPISEVKSLIKSQNLVMNSEDDVIRAIVNWAEFSRIEESQNEIQSLSVNEGGKAILEKKDQIEENDVGNGAEPCRKKSKICHANDNNDITSLSNYFDKSVQTDINDGNQYLVNITTNDIRSKNLTILLSNTRIYLASRECLKMLATHTLVRHNMEAKDIVIEAQLYQLQVDKINGHWPIRAIHRNNSKFKHCLVQAHKSGSEAKFHFFIFARNKWFKLPSLRDITEVKLAATDNKLYAICSKFTRERLLRISINLLKMDTWSEIFIPLFLSSETFSVAVFGCFIYIFSADEMKMWKLDTDLCVRTEMPALPERTAICHTMRYDQCILVFHASTDINADKTIVQCFDTSENTWTQLNNLEGPAQGMTSFIYEHFTYLLQTNGNLWKVVESQSKVIDFEYVVKLWSGNWLLYGVATFIDGLYIHGTKTEDLDGDLTLQRTLPGVFNIIKYMIGPSIPNLMTIPFLLEKSNEEWNKTLNSHLDNKN